ncbi:hypothetical protein [Novipirellula artificiosorum]|uniref:Uncharacterized protein n=1 Tax=Novipirellula artificiosorum TaxID=2528016 RepID=A0A5C6DRZ2_9BACT|nr:hypothetical protein [Novipirellula artificiosorum]TWU39538.1 hypothetical protein Poly41_23930 [Novipirellula artificiosorum]
MRKFGNIVLTLTGVTAAMALCCPMLVVLGFVALIVPGLVLLVAPTVFVYLATTLGIQRILPTKIGWAAFPIATLLALGLGWLVMQPIRSSAISEFHAEVSPDILPGKPIILTGNVYVENGELYRSPECDYLCTMLLDLPGVESVTVESTGPAGRKRDPSVAAFALVRTGENAKPGVFPSNPGQLIRKHPGLMRRVKGNELRQVEKSLEADWALRLAGVERIVEVEPTPAEEADWVVRLVSTHNKEIPRVERVEISRTGNDVQFRRSEVRHFVPGNVFYFDFDLQMAVGTISGASFGIGGSDWKSSDQRIDLEPTLLEAIEVPLLAELDDTRERLRLEVKRAIDDPDASPARLELARRWLSLFFFDAGLDDHQLIARVVGDQRVKDIAGPIENVFSKGETPIELRTAYARRIGFDDATEKERSQLAKALSLMPPGTFVKPDPAHLAIWTRPELYEQAGHFLSRLADLGAERAMPILRDALDHVSTKDNWSQRRAMVEGIRDAYASLGPAAKQDATRISTLVLQRPSPITSGFNDVQAWRLTLARMGVSLDDLPFFPHSSQQQINRTKTQIRDRLQRIQAEI